MSGAEIDLLYRVLDTNKDGLISYAELERAHKSVTSLEKESDMAA
jgi:Ca2+-binding EF-hand superfamily protein